MAEKVTLSFPDLCEYHLTPDQYAFLEPDTILCLDPGETTGYAVFQGFELIEAGQLETKDFHLAIQRLQELFLKHKPEWYIYEGYKVYSWKSDEHKWNDLHTPQLIGTIKTLLVASGHKLENPDQDVFEQMAVQAKHFADDEKLKHWKMWVKGQKHARDAVRHGCYFCLFGKWKDQVKLY